MTRRPPLTAKTAADGIPLEHLAATAQMLADRLSSAAELSEAEARRPRMELFDARDARGPDAGSLATQARSYLRARRFRDELFPRGLFADPAWDMLLNLFASLLENERVCVSSACRAAGVPQTTALRWIDRMEAFGLVERLPDGEDSRRIYVELTELATTRVELWLKAAFRGEVDA